jgi:hypothetical protein
MSNKEPQNDEVFPSIFDIPSDTRRLKSLPAAGRPRSESYSPVRRNKPVPC